MADLSKRLDAGGGSRPVLTVPIAPDANVVVGQRAYTDGTQLIELKDNSFINEVEIAEKLTSTRISYGMGCGFLPNGNFIVVWATGTSTADSYYIQTKIYSPIGELLSEVSTNGGSYAQVWNQFQYGLRLRYANSDGTKIAFGRNRSGYNDNYLHLQLNYNVDGEHVSGGVSSNTNGADSHYHFMVLSPINDDEWFTPSDDDVARFHRFRHGNPTRLGEHFYYAAPGNTTAMNLTYNKNWEMNYSALEGGVIPLYDAVNATFFMADLAAPNAYGLEVIDFDVDPNATNLYINRYTDVTWFTISDTIKGVIYLARDVESGNQFTWRLGEVHWDNVARTSTFVPMGTLSFVDTFLDKPMVIDFNNDNLYLDFYFDSVNNKLTIAMQDVDTGNNVNISRVSMVSDYIPSVSMGVFEGDVETIADVDSINNRQLGGYCFAKDGIFGLGGGHYQYFAALSLTKKIGQRINPPSYVGIVTEVNGNEASVKLKSGGGISEYFVSDDTPTRDSEWMKLDGTWFQKSTTVEAYLLEGGIGGNSFNDSSIDPETLKLQVGVMRTNGNNQTIKFESDVDVQGLVEHQIRMTYPYTAASNAYRCLIGAADGLIIGSHANAWNSNTTKFETLNMTVSTFSSALFAGLHTDAGRSSDVPISYNVEVK